MIAILLRRGAPTPIRAPCCRSSPLPGSAPQGQDYGPLVELVEVLFPDATERETLFWKTLQRLFGFVALGLERKRYANLPWQCLYCCAAKLLQREQLLTPANLRCRGFA
jgi:hypothetical protein